MNKLDKLYRKNKNDIIDSNEFLSYEEQIKYLTNKHLNIIDKNSFLNFVETYGLQKLVCYYSTHFVKNNLINHDYQDDATSDMIIGFLKLIKKLHIR